MNFLGGFFPGRGGGFFRGDYTLLSTFYVIEAGNFSVDQVLVAVLRPELGDGGIASNCVIYTKEKCFHTSRILRLRVLFQILVCGLNPQTYVFYLRYSVSNT